MTGNTLEQRARRYWFRFREMDGSWSQWFECGRARYEELIDADDAEVRHD